MSLFCGFNGFCRKTVKTSIMTNNKFSNAVADYILLNSGA